MTLFSSKRERRLWLWTLAVLLVIYATLGLARTMAGLLREHGLLDTAFMVALGLVAATILVQALKRRPGGTTILVALAIIAVYGLAFLRMTIPEERSHLIEYGVVAILILEALRERAIQGRRVVPAPPALAILLTTLAGTVDECIQWFLPSRVFDTRDILFNALAAVMAVGASVALSWALRRDAAGRTE